MQFRTVFAGIHVADWAAAQGWYERLLGRPADRRPMDGLAEWNLTAGGGIQVIGDAARAGTTVLTLSVDDLDGYANTLNERGIALGSIETGAVSRFVAVNDPDGNTIMLAELRDATN